MAARTNPPWMTFVLLVLLAGLGYAVYEFVYVRRVFASTSDIPSLDRERRDEMRLGILEAFDKDPCFLELGAISFRPRDGKWSVDFKIADICLDEARDTCERISDFLQEEYRLKVSVWAYDDGGSPIAHHIP